MIVVLQRVSEALVLVDGREHASIGSGLMALVGIQREDESSDLGKICTRLLDYRVFPDATGRMNRSLRDVGGALMLVPNFTLAANTRSGLRPGFDTAAPPAEARRIFDALVTAAHEAHERVQCGQFGADMQVQLTNDGPVTLLMEF